MKPYLKDPSAVLDYAFDWNNDSVGPWLQAGETISSHTISVDSGITKDSDSESNGIVTVWLSGGTAKELYVVSCEITTSTGRTDERSIEILMQER